MKIDKFTQELGDKTTATIVHDGTDIEALRLTIQIVDSETENQISLNNHIIFDFKNVKTVKGYEVVGTPAEASRLDYNYETQEVEVYFNVKDAIESC